MCVASPLHIHSLLFFFVPVAAPISPATPWAQQNRTGYFFLVCFVFDFLVFQLPRFHQINTDAKKHAVMHRGPTILMMVNMLYRCVLTSSLTVGPTFMPAIKVHPTIPSLTPTPRSRLWPRSPATRHPVSPTRVSSLEIPPTCIRTPHH